MHHLPILLLGYNRPDLFKMRLKEIAELPITRLYISIDSIDCGPDKQLLDLISEFSPKNPKLDVLIFTQSENLGLTRHITGAIDKVLELEPAVLVLEDDISISHCSYLSFCAGYAAMNDQNILGILGGFSPFSQPTHFASNKWRRSSYFSVWGWVATTQNWQHYKHDLNGIDLKSVLQQSKSWNNLSKFQRHVWLARFARAQIDPLNTWDIQMQFCSFVHDYTNLLPIFRIVENLGFNDSRAAHTKGRKPRWYRDTDVNKCVIPRNETSSFISRLMSIVDSNTYVGDSQIFNIWSHKLKPILLNH